MKTLLTAVTMLVTMLALDITCRIFWQSKYHSTRWAVYYHTQVVKAINARYGVSGKAPLWFKPWFAIVTRWSKPINWLTGSPGLK